METTYLELITTGSGAYRDVTTLLEENGIRMDDAVQKTFGYFSGDQLIGTASTCENTIRSIAVKKNYQGSNVLAEMLNEIILVLYEAGFQNQFIYTKCLYADTFKHLGFFEIERVEPDVVLLERQPNGIQNFATYLETFRVVGDAIGAIVMNANPFTLGHQYLIETAAKQCDFLYIFVVAAEHSAFKHEDRYKMIVDGTAHIANVMVIHGGQYIISDATFPNYFLKQASDATRVQAVLDLKIFSRYFAAALKINRRFIGEEPYCQTTSAYNEAMKVILPEAGIEVIEIPRRMVDDTWISASRVRNLLKENDLEGAAELVPETTFKFLKSPKGRQTIGRIKRSTSRH
jgi:[citrate (pro-3S)-lyase] ligase